ncbi:MAG: YfiR family protein, partial [Nitrosomonadaceae bacterium]|nr:YfiR family protein [Nitrosomonadaceae bacterium]
GMVFYIASIGFAADVQADEAAEYTLKAAFLYNFAIFTTWPDRTTDNFNLCIYGKDPFSQDLDSLMRKKNINERKVIIHRINTIDRKLQNRKCACGADPLSESLPVRLPIHWRNDYSR